MKYTPGLEKLVLDLASAINTTKRKENRMSNIGSDLMNDARAVDAAEREEGGKENALKRLAAMIQEQQIERLQASKLDCAANIAQCETSIKPGKKYTKIDVGTSGKYMIDEEGRIFGIKAYGVINRRWQYGTLDTIDDYYWGNYKAQRKVRG